MPAMFEDVVVSTVTEMVEIVGPVRELRLQQQNPSRFPPDLGLPDFSYLRAASFKATAYF